MLRQLVNLRIDPVGRCSAAGRALNQHHLRLGLGGMDTNFEWKWGGTVELRSEDFMKMGTPTNQYIYTYVHICV